MGKIERCGYYILYLMYFAVNKNPDNCSPNNPHLKVMLTPQYLYKLAAQGDKDAHFEIG